MTTDAARRARLRVLPGGRTRRLRLAQRLIAIAPADNPPFDLDAQVFEEDTFRIMSAAPQWAPPVEHPIRIMHDLQGYRPDRPGDLVVQAGRPTRLLAIVHNVNCEPTWRPEWIAAALRNMLQTAERHRLISIGLPLLGRQHGNMSRSGFADLLADVLAENSGFHPRRLWLIVSGLRSADVVYHALETRL
ncbi:MAG: hypothetical protein QNJ48_14085 [Desulfobacterales bacterium]|nr:hypothetical protein [Desulfobacterales bacterium]MDJ0885291.1 hypothetical protein [Desulfobacterales bacterium]